MMFFYNKLPFPADQLADELYKHDPPDAGVFGGTPGFLELLCKKYKMQATYNCNNPNPDVSLKPALCDGKPTAVLVDLGKLGGTWQAYHYLVAYGYDDENVYCLNGAAAPPPYSNGIIPWNTFLDAWHCWSLPSGNWQYASVTAWFYTPSGEN